MLLCIILFWNLIVFLIYGADKYMAVCKMRRIPEKILLITSAVFGSIGAAMGMLVFNHKTSKPKFRYSIPLLYLAHSAVFYFSLKLL